MTKDMMAKALSDFFGKEGVETMDLQTYKSHGVKAPVKDYMLRRAFGSWNRVLSAMKKRHPVVVAVEAPTPTPAPAPKAKTAPKAKKKAEK
jgi:hypothetical protein|tara:strand:+ start:1220 stop:1492 length:273 start_codon:yes stop_codon:yes gene_type:complete